MKATGIVRRIDDLGRVVIPKEIRRTLAIREGDPLEIYTTDGGVLFRKSIITQIFRCIFVQIASLTFSRNGDTMSTTKGKR